MKAAVLLFVVVLAACGNDEPTEKCIDGVLYLQFKPGGVWRMKDGAESHAGYTPIPCKPPNNGDSQPARESR